MMFKGPAIVLLVATAMVVAMVLLIGLEHVLQSVIRFWPVLVLGAATATVLLMLIWDQGFSYYANQYARKVEENLAQEQANIRHEKAATEAMLAETRALREKIAAERHAADTALKAAKAMRRESEAQIADAERRRINATAAAERRKRKLARLQASA